MVWLVVHVLMLLAYVVGAVSAVGNFNLLSTDEWLMIFLVREEPSVNREFRVGSKSWYALFPIIHKVSMMFYVCVYYIDCVFRQTRDEEEELIWGE